MKTQRGDVALVLFPNSDLRTAKRRPALILQRDNLGSGLSQTIVAMISPVIVSLAFMALTCSSSASVDRARGQGRQTGLQAW